MFRTHRRHVLQIGLAGLSAALFGMPARSQTFPARPISLIVPYAAGGGTDAVGRMLANQMEKDMGQPVNVVNRTGGNGAVGLVATASASPDGYTIGLITVEATMLHGQGLTEVSQSALTPIAMVNADPAAVFVTADSPYASVSDLAAAAKAAPGKLKCSGAAAGGIYHLALAGMLRSLGSDPLAIGWIPSNGAAPALQDLAAGGVQAVVCTLPEGRSLMDAGKVKALAVMARERSPLFGTVPTLQEAGGGDWTALNWRALVAAKGVPAAIQQRLFGAAKNAVESKEYKDFLQQRGFGAAFAEPDALGRQMASSETELTEIARSIGLVKKS